MEQLTDRVIFITGASRGIGRAMALRFARAGAKIAVVAKTAAPHPTLKGTIHQVAEEIIQAGGEALPIAVDIRDEIAVQEAVTRTVEHFGAIDVVINNASAISLTDTTKTQMKRYDLMQSVNVRGTFCVTQACLPFLQKSKNPHILTLSPPVNLDPRWFKDHLAYTLSKYGMSLCTLGWAAEFKKIGIAANSLWPKTTIATAAIEVHFPPEIYRASRHPDILADAAYAIITRPSHECTGNFFIDEDILREQGIEDFSRYAVDPDVTPFTDLFLEDFHG